MLPPLSLTHTGNVTAAAHPYDSLQYESSPIEWLAPERLALASRLHGGPRLDLQRYRYLEIGCGNGANLVPLAFYRRHGSFVGLDVAPSACAALRSKRATLGLGNLEIVEADLVEAASALAAQGACAGCFDFIVAHGVFSWISEATRTKLLKLCEHYLAPNGLLYLSYNARPGWDVRGLVRAYLVGQTQRVNAGLAVRAKLAQRLAAQLIPPLQESPHPFSQLLANELELVREAHFSYVGHDYLAEHNRAFWRTEFLELLTAHGFTHVADADFNYSSGRVSEAVLEGVADLQLPDHAVEDTIDLLSFRQFHCPVLTRNTSARSPLSSAEFEALLVASCLQPTERVGEFIHPSGYRVETHQESMQNALLHLARRWPTSAPVARLFSDPLTIREDLLLLQKNGLIELRLAEPEATLAPDPLHALEAPFGYRTTPWHTREALDSQTPPSERQTAE